MKINEDKYLNINNRLNLRELMTITSEALSKYNSVMFQNMMKLHSFLKLPAMTWKEIYVYKKILTKFYDSPSLEIFEYGSGFSTVFYANFLKKRKIDFELTSIDNNREWHETVKNMVKDNKLDRSVSSHLSSFGPFWEKSNWDWNIAPKPGEFAPRLKEEFEYINFPLNLGKTFDIILIDGRFRRRCLEIAPKCLKKKGIVFLHDAQKEQYHQPFSSYKYSKLFYSGKYFPFDNYNFNFWVGSINNSIVDQLLPNMLRLF